MCFDAGAHRGTREEDVVDEQDVMCSMPEVGRWVGVDDAPGLARADVVAVEGDVDVADPDAGWSTMSEDQPLQPMAGGGGRTGCQ